ncbi:MAG: 2TM domain-containing protein [Rhodospirillales bacterium]
MLILVPLNAFVYDGSAWSVFPLVGWGSALAVHAALVLGLFGRSNPNQ